MPYLLAFFMFFVAMHQAQACEPCPEMATLAEVVEMAELIVIGHRDDAPWFFDDNNSNDGPSQIKIKIQQVLKGQTERDIITVSSWAGMCGYGIIMFKETALLLLKAQEGSGVYAPPDHCGPKQFTIIDGWLNTQNMRGSELINVPLMPVDEFRETYLKE